MQWKNKLSNPKIKDITLIFLVLLLSKKYIFTIWLNIILIHQFVLKIRIILY